MAVLFYGSVIAAMALYANIVATAKKIKNNENTAGNTFLGSILVGFIIYSLMLLWGR